MFMAIGKQLSKTAKISFILPVPPEITRAVRSNAADAVNTEAGVKQKSAIGYYIPSKESNSEKHL